MTRPAADIVCLSHLRWNFVYQRPNHLMARAARGHRVYFVEEAERRGTEPHIEAVAHDGLTIVRPVLPDETWGAQADAMLRVEIDRFLASEGIDEPWLWYYTPMAMRWTSHLRASAVIYDCMDELSNFKFAPADLGRLEQQLIERSDVVFTGGRSLYEAKRDRHPSTFLFPSSVDGAHFRRARSQVVDPVDQAQIGRPRIGYYGVIDERIDLLLIEGVAAARPEWNLVMVGPVAKIADDELPRGENIHWLGLKSYDELPDYLGGWDVAMMPFALNDSTRFISPTKTPEYLSGGRPVVSTAIADVVRPYGDEGLVHIADSKTDSVGAFVRATELALEAHRSDLVSRADRFLATQSWDATWTGMEQIVNELRPQRAVVQLPARARTEAARPLSATRPAFARVAASAPPGGLGAGAGRQRPR